MKRLAIMVVCVAALWFASIANAATPKGGSWEIAWRPAHCPVGFFCKRWTQTEPNYGQALKLERLLKTEGYAVSLTRETA